MKGKPFLISEIESGIVDVLNGNNQ